MPEAVGLAPRGLVRGNWTRNARPVEVKPDEREVPICRLLKSLKGFRARQDNRLATTGAIRSQNGPVRAVSKNWPIQRKALLGLARGEFSTYAPAPSLVQLRWTERDWAGAFGGSVDVYFSDSIAWRIAQPELLWTTFQSSRKDFRVATGVVLRFGRKR